jgi:DNA-binding CsgD family transcriptional regulator/tetratricopeptide (TPR) repeat protein
VTPALLERATELSALDSCLGAVRTSSRGHVLLVGGEAGVGKTMLVRRFCEELGATGSSVLWGACDPLFAPRPLGPLRAVGQATGGELEAVVERGAMPYEVVEALGHELSTRGPTVLVLEDVHWADEATLDVLRLLARRVETVPALVVATYRDDELGLSRPLLLVLGELATSPSVDRIKLAPLTSDAIVQLAEPYGVDPDELHRKTAGNPFFVVEALAVEEGGIPDTVRDAVLARAARLSPAARRVLEAVAVAPPLAELWLLEGLAGDEARSLDECVTSGMLSSEPVGVVFRHELARLAIEESVAPHRKRELHRRALAALADPPDGGRDLARLAHHAEHAGDGDAVLRFAPEAGDAAASLGAYREAAAQYARALRFGDRLSPGERAQLLERRSRACYLTDDNDAAVAAITEAREYRHQLGEILEEGAALSWLSLVLWCPGRAEESELTAREAVGVLEGLPPCRELAMAHANLAYVSATFARSDDAQTRARQALDLAEQVDDPEIALHARTTIAACEPLESGYEELERCLEEARAAGYDEQVARIGLNLVGMAVGSRRYDLAEPHLCAGLDFCSERGLERDRLYFLEARARVALDRGRWAEAADSAAAVLRIPRSSVMPHIRALVVLGLVEARRGEAGSRCHLDEALMLAEPTRTLLNLGPVAAARAEAGWLHGDCDLVAEATEHTIPLAMERRWLRLAGELVDWRRRAGLAVEIPPGTPEPYALQLAGEWSAAAERWREIGCPYEEALALADADEEQPLRRALEMLQVLGARPAAAIVAGRLREMGVRGLPRGPRPATRRNPAGLTPRELEVLQLVSEGLRNAEIAARLVLSERTVDHHVQAILRKLRVRSRAQASAQAVRLGLVHGHAGPR